MLARLLRSYIAVQVVLHIAFYAKDCPSRHKDHGI